MSAARTYLCLAILSAGCALAAREPGEALRPGFNFFSKEQDVALGREAAQQVRQEFEVVQDSFLQSYVRGIGERLAAQPEARESGFPFEFTVVNRKEVNAFALPGGPMFIFSGLIGAADNEAQLAGVMAHEMSHVILRHGTHQASRANVIAIPLALAGAALGSGSMLSELARFGLNLGANSYMLKFSRDSESEADALGAHLMAEAGYNPIEMARFFYKLQESGGQGDSRLAQFLSDHPNPGNRERAIQAEVATLPRRSYTTRSGDFGRAQAVVAKLPAPRTRG